LWVTKQKAHKDFAGKDEVGVNPKINNLIKGYRAAKHDVLWVCDSNVYLHPNSLSQSVARLCEPGVMLVHHLPVALPSCSFGSFSEALYLNTAHAKLYLYINWLNVASCVVGKSNLYRKSDIMRVGGFEQFGKYLAEDNMIAERLYQIGGGHRLSMDICWQPLGNMSFKDFFSRRSRWTRIRKYMVPAATVVEPITESLLCGVVGWFGLSEIYGISFLKFMCLHLMLWCAFDWSLYKVLLSARGLREQHENRLCNPLRFIFVWIIRELSAFPLFLYAVSGNSVEWRQDTYRLSKGGTIVPRESKTPTDVTPFLATSATTTATTTLYTIPSQTETW
jgi:ceramide glucosyltransferase